MAGRLWCGTVVLAVLLCTTGRAPAQDAPPADPLEGLRENTTFTTTDDQTIDAWLTARIDELQAAAAAEADDADARDALIEAGTSFLRAIRAEMVHSAATAQFLARFAGRTDAAFAARFQQNDAYPAEVAWYFARALLDMKRVETRDALTAGLAYPAESVRYLCAKTFARLQSDLAPDLALARNTIQLLQTAGQAEASGIVLGAIYEAMAYGDHLEEAIPALVSVFAARVRKLQNREILTADRAELTAWEFLGKRQIRPRIPNAQKGPLVRELAAFFVVDVNRYGPALGNQKVTLAERIEVCETLIDALVGPIADKGNVRSEMKQGGVAPEINMKLELLKWVGGQGQEGCLKDAPWSVPVGGLPSPSP